LLLGGAVVAGLTCAAVVVLFGGGPAVAVVETGYSVVEGGDEGTGVSVGVVVENRTDKVARLTMVTVEIEGTGDDDCCENTYGFTIRTLLPGQRVGIGATWSGPGSGVTGIDVSVHGPADAETSLPPIDRRTVPIEEVTTSFSPANEPLVSFTTQGPRPWQDVDAFAIFRNADGDIVGGAGINGKERPAGVNPRRLQVAAGSRIPDAVTVEVYAFP
jgi:hypothetical protein